MSNHVKLISHIFHHLLMLLVALRLWMWQIPNCFLIFFVVQETLIIIVIVIIIKAMYGLSKSFFVRLFSLMLLHQYICKSLVFKFVYYQHLSLLMDFYI
uniref:Adenylyl-sulfate kinase n=1 Tax=Rhizophora mucronata TaxID=61149 RepID=A0A2P2L0H0_RHIMU